MSIPTTHEAFDLIAEASKNLADLLSRLESMPVAQMDAPRANGHIDPRWRAIGKTHFQEGLMALNRAVMADPAGRF